MKCKKHPADLSSSVGVCASCLRESLFALIAAQAWKQAEVQEVEVKKKSSGGKFSSLFSGLFRSKSEKSDSDSGPSSDPGVMGIAQVMNPQDSCTSSLSWFPTIHPARQRKQISTLSLDKNLIGDHRTIF
ncbi:uncharacterized protein Fot_48397 [Forsythia ovata]|uniref:Uncharacterized protein n=1 Tax=Forsythia ovata TaxID=205694 RepID=A0ABD1QD72_9LAMI